MKNIFENKTFLITVFALEAIVLILGIYGAIYGEGHESFAMLFLAFFVLGVFNAVFFILLGFFNSNQIKFYIKLQGLLVVILFVVLPTLAYFNGDFEDDYEYSDEEIQMVDEMKLREKLDSIRVDSLE